MALRPKGRDNVFPTLDVVIRDLSLVKDSCGVQQAQAAFDSTTDLLTTIRVRHLLFSGGKLPTDVFLVRDGQRRGLCVARALLRRCMHGPQPGIERQTVG